MLVNSVRRKLIAVNALGIQSSETEKNGSKIATLGLGCYCLSTDDFCVFADTESGRAKFHHRVFLM